MVVRENRAQTPRRWPPQTTFTRHLRHMMLDRDLLTPGHLHSEMLKAWDGGVNGRDKPPSRTLIYAYFNGQEAPQPWFLLAVAKTFARLGVPLNEAEWNRLRMSYIDTYKPELRALLEASPPAT
jgi:hypothetical protein